MNALIKPPTKSAADEYGPFLRNTLGNELAMTKEQQADETRRWVAQLQTNGGDLRSMDDSFDFDPNADAQFDHRRRNDWQ